MQQDVFLQNLKKYAEPTTIEKCAGIWSAAKNVANGALGVWGGAGVAEHYSQGKDIKSIVSKPPKHPKQATLEKEAFLGTIATAAGKITSAIAKAGNNKWVQRASSLPVVGATLAAETGSGIYKSVKDQNYQIHQELQKQQSQQNQFKKQQQQSFKDMGLNKTATNTNTIKKKADNFIVSQIKSYNKRAIKGKIKEEYNNTQKDINDETNTILKGIKKSVDKNNFSNKKNFSDKERSFSDRLEKEAGILSTLGNAVVKGVGKVIDKAPKALKTWGTKQQINSGVAGNINAGLGAKAQNFLGSLAAKAGSTIQRNGQTIKDNTYALTHLNSPKGRFYQPTKVDQIAHKINNNKVVKFLGNDKTKNFVSGVAGLTWAADTAISLNNTRKNIQTAAPSVPSLPPIQQPQTNMYNGGSHPASYQNTYGI